MGYLAIFTLKGGDNVKVEHKEYIKQLLQDFPNHIITSINLSYENNIIATDPLDLLPLLTFKWFDFQQYTIWDYFKYYDLFKQFENYEHFQQIYKYCSEQQAAFDKLLKYDYNYVFNHIFSYLSTL